MKKLLILPLLGFGLLFSQVEPVDRGGADRDVKLPNGKSQQEEILKVEFKKTLEDAAELVKLAEQLQDDLIKDDRHVLSMSSLKQLDNIEKLTKRIRSRLNSDARENPISRALLLLMEFIGQGNLTLIGNR